jgi:hypothetical protein
MRIRIPPKRIREKFLIVYELQGCQKATDFLTEFYDVKKMKIILDGKRVGKRKVNRWVACYLKNRAFFTKEGLSKRVLLHEFFHHLVSAKGCELTQRIEEKEANAYAKLFLKR